MSRLRFARDAFDYSTSRLAAELRVSEQAIEGWEKGTVTPTLAEQRDLAVLYGTRVDDLAGNETLADRPVRSVHMTAREGIDGFWGHLGVLLPAARTYRWYPITAGAAETVANEIERRRWLKDDAPELLIETLNNRLLWLNLAVANGVCLCHDAAEWPQPYQEPLTPGGLAEMDLEVRPDHFLSGEYYQVMTEMIESEEVDSHRVSERLSHQVEAFLSEREDVLGEVELARLLLHARLWMSDGSCQWIEASAESMAEAVSELQLDAGDGLLRLSGPDQGYLSYAISLERVAVLELPAGRL